MVTTDLTKISSLSLPAAVGIFFTLAMSSGQAAEVEAGIRVGISQTDNVYLDPSPLEVEDLVLNAAPWISIIHESPNFDANFRYLFDWYKYEATGPV